MSPFFDPHAGGVEAYVRRLTEELARRGHEVTVLTSRYDRALPEEERRDGYRIVRSRTLGVLLDTPIDTGTRRLVRTLPADVAHLHYPPPLTSYFATRGLAGRSIPICLTYHCDLYRPGPVGRLLTALYEGLFLPPTLDRAKRIVAHTRTYAETSTPLRGRAVDIIPSAVDLDRFRPDVDGTVVRARLGLGGRRVILFTGRLVPHKGVDQILRALALLPKDVALVVVGRGPARGARRPRPPPRDRGPGPLLPVGRGRGAPGVLPGGRPLRLPVPQPPRRVRARRRGGHGLGPSRRRRRYARVREVIEPGVEGLLADPLLLSDLAEKVRELLDDPGRRAVMGAAARRRAESRYGVATVVDALVSLYGSLIEAG